MDLFFSLIYFFFLVFADYDDGSKQQTSMTERPRRSRTKKGFLENERRYLDTLRSQGVPRYHPYREESSILPSRNISPVPPSLSSKSEPAVDYRFPKSEFSFEIDHHFDKFERNGDSNVFSSKLFSPSVETEVSKNDHDEIDTVKEHFHMKPFHLDNFLSPTSLYYD